jgi:hypothetical protein
MPPSDTRLRYAQLVLVAAALVAGEVIAVARHGLAGRWIMGADGIPNLYDFAAFWVAGNLALEGNSVAAYDWETVRAAEFALTGSTQYVPFLNPPIFLLAMLPLSALPYHVAFLSFIVLSACLYAFAIGAIAGRWTVFVALASPAVIACASVGQNGILSAALIGWALLTIERRPVLGGLLLSLMTYKPQFGVLFPLALGSSRRWETFAAASIGSLVLLALCGGVFGLEIFQAAMQGLSMAWQEIVINGFAGWRKLHSLYGLMRTLGLGHWPSLVAQTVLATVCAAVVLQLWRSPVPYELKAAGLAATCLLAPAYVFIYDFPILSVAFAFLWRDQEFDRVEWGGLGLCVLLLYAVPNLLWPIGFFSPLVALGLVFRRTWALPAPNFASEVARAGGQSFGENRLP